MRNHEKSFPEVDLRPANPEDEEFLLDLFASTRSEELALMILDTNQKEALVAMQFRAQSGNFFMSYPRAQNSIILWNGDPIGRILFDRGELEFTLVDIALLPDHRNKGIGTSLIEDLVKEAAAAGKPIRLHVSTSNSARRLYERLGFSPIVAVDAGDAAYVEMTWVPRISQP